MTGRAHKVIEGIWMVGDGALSHAKDACVYLIDGGADELALVDTGAGDAPSAILKNIESIGKRSSNIKWILITHCHIDHTGGINQIRKVTGAQVICHAKCAEVLETGDSEKSAARWYGTHLDLTPVDVTFESSSEIVRLGNLDINLIYTPGHSPCSISIYLDMQGKRVLFGQDIHGPFSPMLGSDIGLWKESMKKLIDLKADILCEGHYGVIQPNSEVEKFIKSFLKNHP